MSSKRIFRKLIFILPIIFCYSQVSGQHLTLNTYSNQTEIKSSESVTLADGFYIPAGNTVRIYIGSDHQSIPLGIVQDEIIKVPGITRDDQIYSLTVDQKKTIRSYIDGFGRAIQTIDMKGSPQQKDIVQINNYDNLGRQTTEFMPYTAATNDGSYKATAITEQSIFYNNGSGDKVADDSSPFSKAVFENSPLQRVLQIGTAGEGLQPGQHFKSAAYKSNTVADAVINWSSNGTNQGFYAANSLSGILRTDEQGNQSVNFTNLNGQLILKRELINEVINGISETTLDTYYIYNESGAISYIVPPKAIALMRSNSNWNLDQIGVSKLLFRYAYDNRGRLIEKTIPGSSIIYIVYDPLSRPVLVQDGNLRGNNQWNYIKYDVKGRVIGQGIYTDINHIGRSIMQTYVDAINYSINYYESRSSNSTYGFYTNNIFPTSGIQDLAYAYYDDYDMDNNGTADYNYNVQGLTGETSATSLTRGKLTMIRKKGIGAGLSNTWLTNVQFYDKQSNVIQVVSNNQFNTSMNDVKTVVPDFTGKPLHEKVTKVVGSVTTSVLSDYNYDHADRVTSINQYYNNNPAIEIAKYSYNELGQLVDKQLHSTNNGASFLQSVDYRYNIKGALLSINNSTLTADDKNDDTNDVFGMELLYDKLDANLNNTPYYNGTISAVRWMSKDLALKQKSYKFNYDDLSRLKNANFADRPSGSTVWTNNSGFDEKDITYDHNGNIMSLKRNAIISNAVTPVDNLTYTYDGNQLTNVADGTGGNYGLIGFRNLTGSTAAYTYNDNGSLISDPKKGLTLAYNVLGKTDHIMITTSPGRHIDYNYDASGNLLRKQVYDNNIAGKVTDYIDGFVYENGVLAYFGMPEGRVRNTGTSLKPEYMIADQQGNVRVSFEEQAGLPVVRQENSYYPFGLIMPGSTVATPTAANTKLYNAGSEWQNDYSNLPDYYNTFYRNYDAALGRFIGVDPKAESSDSWTSYHYAGNNPILYNDPLGDIKLAQMVERLYLSSGSFGGYWTEATGYQDYTSDADAFNQAARDMGFGGNFGSFGFASSYESAAANFNAASHTGGNVASKMVNLPGVSVVAGNNASYLAAHDEIQRQMDEADQGGDGNNASTWYDNGNKINAAWGTASTIVGMSHGSVGYLKAGAVSLNYYASGWGGGSRALIQTAKVANIAKFAGGAGALAGLTMDVISLNKGTIGLGKFSLNQGMSIVGFTEAAPLSVAYFGIDAFYPGGINAASNDEAKIYTNSFTNTTGAIPLGY